MNQMPIDPARRHQLLTELVWAVYQIAIDDGHNHTTPTQHIAHLANRHTHNQRTT